MPASQQLALTLAPTGNPLAAIRANETQQERHARRVYIGNFPMGGNSEELRIFLNELYNARRPDLAQAAIGGPMLMISANADKGFAFGDMAGPEHATWMIALFDNCLWKGNVIRVRRPKDYLPPPEGDPAVRLRTELDKSQLPSPVPSYDVEEEVPDGPGKVFIGNLNKKLRKDEIVDCLWGIAPVRAFKLVLERPDSELNAGHAFVEFTDPEITRKAILALNGAYIAGSHWTACLHEPPADASAGPDYSIPLAAKPLLVSIRGGGMRLCAEPLILALGLSYSWFGTSARLSPPPCSKSRPRCSR